jgi:hypothetical protein
VITPLAAGIVMYNCPIRPTRISNAMYTSSKRISENNVIEGNIIKGFSYGIFSLGMGAHLDDKVTVRPMYNKNNSFVNNFIEDVTIGGI